jgi:hypothetical protein
MSKMIKKMKKKAHKRLAAVFLALGGVSMWVLCICGV